MAERAFLTPIEGKAYCGCGCGARASHAAMSAHTHPGFGGVLFTRNGGPVPTVWTRDEEESLTFQDYEDIAAADPDADWRLRIDGPLSDYTYQRQGDAMWALVEQGPGFA